MTAERQLRRDEATGLLLVNGPEDIPNFATDEDETDFWETHDFSEAFWKTATRGAPLDSLHTHVTPKHQQTGQQAS